MIINPALLAVLVTLSMSVGTWASDVDYHCGRISADDSTPWPVLLKLLSGADKVRLSQHWRAQPEATFERGAAGAAWTSTFLCVYATFQDKDTFNPVVGFNKPAYQKGDVFEILLRSLEGEAYYEFHVTPGEQMMQLRFPAADSLEKFGQTGGGTEKLIGTFGFSLPAIQCYSVVHPQEQTWDVLVKIPARLLAGTEELRGGARFKFSFCRYDYGHDRAEPVLSSSSPYAECNFHRQQDWLVMTLEGGSVK